MHRSEPPILELKLKSSPRLSLTLPYRIDFTIRRSAQDNNDKPCIFHWSPHIHGFTRSDNGFVLLHHRMDGTLEKVNTGNYESLTVPDQNRLLVVSGHEAFLWELSPGGQINFTMTLPEQYHKMVLPKETYTLMWSGGEIDAWKWGTIHENINQELTSRFSPGQLDRPRLWLPQGPCITFTAEEESVAWPARAEAEARSGFLMANLAEQAWRNQHFPPPSPPPIGSDEQVLGAPVFRVTLECPPHMIRGQIFDVVIKVTYVPISDNSTASSKPITFHTYAFIGLNGPREGLRLYRRRKNYSEWQTCKLDIDGFMIVDNPDITVCVGQHPHFTSLLPGESWRTTYRLQSESWAEFPHDTAAGDVFRMQFKGAAEVDWWDWGTRDVEHKDTFVDLPCWIMGPVMEPKDNEGRQKIIVPASNIAEFTVV